MPFIHSTDKVELSTVLTREEKDQAHRTFPGELLAEEVALEAATIQMEIDSSMAPKAYVVLLQVRDQAGQELDDLGEMGAFPLGTAWDEWIKVTGRSSEYPT